VPLAALPWTLGKGFIGLMDEVRVWNVARTQEQIRDQMRRALSGNEPGLVSFWNFEDATNGIIEDRARGGHDGRLVGAAGIVTPSTPVRAEPPTSELFGTITDSTGSPATNAAIIVSQNGAELRRTLTDTTGAYSFKSFDELERFELT